MNQEQIMQQLQAAVALHKQGELDQAEAIYRQILAVDADNFYALNFCGCVCREKKRFEEGIDLLSRAVMLQPGSPDAVYNLGNLFKDAERWDEAIACYEKTLGWRAEYPEALNNLGICLQEVGRYEHSEIALRRAVSMHPGFAGAWLNLGNTFKEQGKFEEAIASYRKAIEVKPDFADVYFALGNVLKEDGEVVEAIASYRKAIEVKPDFADAYLNLGNVLKEEGDVEEAIASYRKAVEVKPDFADAYLKLGNALKEEGKVEEARQIVAAFRHIKTLGDEALIAIEDKTLVFDWHHRRAMNLFWEVELAAALIGNESSSCIAAVKKADTLCFSPLFLGERELSSYEEGKLLYENGYLIEEDLVSPDLCTQLISQFNNVKDPMSLQLIESVAVNGILRSVLEKMFLHTGFSHLIWNCIYFSKGPQDEAISDAWHYDNHYNVWTPKLMIYLNSQQDVGGATHFVNAGLSQQISEKSDYVGLLLQRESYADRVKGLVEELKLNPVTLDPEHYVFSPEKAGSGVWFCPARSLHRGVSPKKGVRHVLSFSLTPLPADCGWSVDQCVEQSVEILKDKIKKGMQKVDVNPYWISAEVGSD